MAAVAPASVAAPVPADEAAAPADEHEPMDDDHEHDDENDHDDEDHEEEEHVKEWDEGGKSHCGYGDTVHDTLMSIGQSIHKVVGEPTETVQEAMHTIGNWFQEASYAARDLKRGKMDVAEETAAAMKSVVTKEEEEDGEGDEGGAVEEAGSRDEDEGLTPVKEDPKEADVSASTDN